MNLIALFNTSSTFESKLLDKSMYGFDGWCDFAEILSPL